MWFLLNMFPKAAIAFTGLKNKNKDQYAMIFSLNICISKKCI